MRALLPDGSGVAEDVKGEDEEEAHLALLEAGDAFFARLKVLVACLNAARPDIVVDGLSKMA